jgi:copper chaperone CopZ
MPTPSVHPQAASADQPLTYVVAGMTCDHCKVAVTEEVTKVGGVTAVDVDLDTKLVQVHGSDVDTAAVVAAIDEAGYDAVTA